MKKDYYMNIYKTLYKDNDTNIIKLIYRIMFNDNLKAHILFYKMYESKSKFRKQLYYNKLQRKYSMLIAKNAKIGENILFAHLNGIVIGEGSIIGDNCIIYHQATIGQKDNKYPKIGNNVIIYPGAKIIGDIIIGNNVVVGANSVVTKSIPDNCIVAGVPAKIIKKISE